MDLEDAFCAVEHLASQHRLLVGRGYRDEPDDQDELDDQREPMEIDWGAGDVRDIARLRGLEFVSEIGPALLEIYDAYVAGTPRTMTSISWTDTAITFIVLGAESPDEIAESLRWCAEELVSRKVTGYLSERFSDWKRPLAKVLPFRSRNPT